MRIGNKSIIIVGLFVLQLLILPVNFLAYTAPPEIDQISSERAIPRTSGNFEWSLIEVISEPVPGFNNNGLTSFSPRIAVENGKVYAVWEDESLLNNCGADMDIFYRYYDGSIWSDIQIISEPIEDQNKNIADSENPDIVVKNGKIYVVWQDKNNTNNAGTDFDVFYRTNLTGLGWEDVQIISEPVPGQNVNIGSNSFYPWVSLAVENDNIYVVWNDGNDTNGAGMNLDVSYRCNLSGSGWGEIEVISEPIPGQDNHIWDAYSAEIAVENTKLYVVWNHAHNTSGNGADSDIFCIQLSRLKTIKYMLSGLIDLTYIHVVTIRIYFIDVIFLVLVGRIYR
jgi:hypothetical protein